MQDIASILNTQLFAGRNGQEDAGEVINNLLDIDNTIKRSFSFSMVTGSDDPADRPRLDDHYVIMFSIPELVEALKSGKPYPEMTDLEFMFQFPTMFPNPQPQQIRTRPTGYNTYTFPLLSSNNTLRTLHPNHVCFGDNESLVINLNWTTATGVQQEFPFSFPLVIGPDMLIGVQSGGATGMQNSTRSPMRQSDDARPSNNAYILRAFVVHIGSSRNFGHYIAYVRRAGQWYCVDDNRVQEVTSILNPRTGTPYFDPESGLLSTNDNDRRVTILFYELYQTGLTEGFYRFVGGTRQWTAGNRATRADLTR